MAANKTNRDLNQLSEDELYEMIGQELAGKPMFPLTRNELIQRGRAWYSTNIDNVRAAICPHAKTLTEDNDERAAIIAVADLLTGLLIHVTPVTAAALIVKIGIKKLCGIDK